MPRPKISDEPVTPPSGDDRAAARAATREARHQELLDAVVALVRRDGPFVTMEQIASECGITKPIIYRHFGDRDGLLLEIAMRFVEQLATDLLPMTADDRSAREVLVATMDAYLALIERDTNLYRFLSDNAGTDKRDILTRLIAEEVALVLERRLHAAGLDVDAGRPWAYGLVGMVHFAGDWWSEQKPVSRADLVERLITLAWDGLGSVGLDEPAGDGGTPTPPRRTGARRATSRRTTTGSPARPTRTNSPRSRTKEP